MTSEKQEKEPVVYKDIHHAINEIYKRVGYVQKKGKIQINDSRSYTVATEAEFIAAIRPEMEDVGIYQQPYNVQVITNERLETAKDYNGKRTITYTFRSVIHAIYRFTHKDSGTFVDVPAIGEGQDSGDKAFYKAMTGANKYAVRQLFMIETGDDPDKYASIEQESIIDEETITTEQAVEIDVEANELNVIKDKFLKELGVDHVTKIKAGDFKKAKALLAQKRDYIAKKAAENAKPTTN